MNNRILAAIETAKKLIQAKNFSPERISEMSKKMDMQLDEYVLLQQQKNVAMLNGKFSLEETQTIYGFLGETLEHINAQPLEVKWVMAELLVRLLDEKIKR